jgi:hypothetical protein
MQAFQSSSAPPATQNPEIEAFIARQRKQDFLHSMGFAAFCLFLLGVVLWLFSVWSAVEESPVIVTYVSNNNPEERPQDRPELTRGMKPKPNSASSASARVIAAALASPISVPMPEVDDPTGPFGMDDDFNAGFGSGDGDGDGGGGSSFFGTGRPGKRVVYIVDFSLSMESDVVTGGTRLAALKKELVRSIDALGDKMNFSVIFFSHNAWSFEVEGPKPADRGWNGLNETPSVNWYPALANVKQRFISRIEAMPAHGNTSWYPPLKMAFNMKPAPDTIYLLSDGEPRDYDQVLDEMDEINPSRIPVDTIAFELPGTPARYMMDISKATGGKFSMVLKGKLIPGIQAEKYTASSYDDSVE